MSALSALNFNFWSFILQVANLLAIFGLLYFFLHKPLGQVLAGREARIKSALDEAAAARDKANALLSDYEAKLAESRREAQAIIERAQALSEATRAEILAAAKAQAERQLAEARQEIAAEQTKALAAIRQEAADLAVLAAGKVIGRALTSADHQRLAQEFVESVGDLQ